MTSGRRRRRSVARNLDDTLRRGALAILTLALALATGAGLARWALTDVEAYRAQLSARHDSQPLYARDQPIANQFWARQDESVYAITGPRGPD
jgi:hypothetical protein